MALCRHVQDDDRDKNGLVATSGAAASTTPNNSNNNDDDDDNDHKAPHGVLKQYTRIRRLTSEGSRWWYWYSGLPRDRGRAGCAGPCQRGCLVVRLLCRLPHHRVGAEDLP